MKSCIIFGGNGFIGSHLAEGLVRNDYEVKVFCRNPDSSNLAGIKNDIEILQGDFLNETDVKRALDGVDYLFHYISTTNPATSVMDPVFDITSNIAGSVRLFQAATDCGVKKILFSSSGGTVYGETQRDLIKEDSPLQPQNPYGISKVAIESYLRYFFHTYGMEYLILRYSNPYGERQNPLAKQGVIPIFLNKIKHNEQPIIFGDGSTIRDYIYIQDAIEATLACLDLSTNDSVFNVGSGQGVSLNQLVDIMSEVTGTNVHPRYVSDSKIFVSRIVLDISRISKVTGWVPKVSIQEGISKTWEWIASVE
jgi:UDP-glucose 4-epimerase